MSSEAKHTPTPWMSGGCVVWQKNGDMVCDLSVAMRSPNVTEANTEYIVKCVNNHAALVSALRSYFDYCAGGDIPAEIQEKAKALLAGLH